MFGHASGSQAKEIAHLLNCQRPMSRRPGEDEFKTFPLAGRLAQGRPA
jgi:hypothetical protein